MLLVRARPRRRHVSHDAVDELEHAILGDMRVAPLGHGGPAASGISFLARVLERAGVNAGTLLRAGGRPSSGEDRTRDFFAVLMGLDASVVAPWFLRRGRKSVYLFDAWPARHGAIVDFVTSWGVQYAFVSSSQAAERLAAVAEHCTFVWVPEGVDPTRYEQRPPAERDIDVLQLGRRYDAHHEKIAPVLARSGRSYLYEREKGRLVFPSRPEFTAGLARSKISICVPSNVTHPERAGDISTMTTRYLQSMASKCIILGHAPPEMVALFGYNPVVEIEMSSAGEQVLEVLDHHEDYLPLVEKNHESVCREHTWARRWERMAAVLFGA